MRHIVVDALSGGGIGVGTMWRSFYVIVLR